MSLRGYGNKSHLEVTIPENASLAIQTVDNGEELVVGWVRVVSDGLLRGTTSFQFSQADEIIREAGVADAVPTGNANLFVNVSGVFNAGVAIANPTEQDTQVTFRLLLGAEEVATKTLPLASGAHMANFLTELFPDEVGTSFEGTLVIESHIPVVITAIRTKGGLQISSYPVGQAVR